MVFDNDEQLKKFIANKCAAAVANAENKVYTEFAGNLNQFYSEFSPEYYIRTGALFNSLDSTGVMVNGNNICADVFFHTPSYQNGEVLLQDGSYGIANWSGDKVLYIAMKGLYPHGGYASGTMLWDDTLEALGGRKGIEEMLKSELKKQGL